MEAWRWEGREQWEHGSGAWQWERQEGSVGEGSEEGRRESKDDMTAIRKKELERRAGRRCRRKNQDDMIAVRRVEVEGRARRREGQESKDDMTAVRKMEGEEV